MTEPVIAQQESQPVSIVVEGYGEIQALSGERLAVALERGGVDILHRCGGVAKCTTCRVEFSAGEPDEMTVAEYDKLTEKGLLGTARLSCQIRVAEGMVLKPVQTEANSGLERGKAISEEIQPEAQWTVRPGASTEG